MKPPDFEYARPSTVAEAVGLLAAADGEGKVLAGGQSLVPLLNFRLAAPRLLVDINRIDGFGFLDRAGDVLRVGAGTRMRALELDPLVRHTLPVLAAAASWVGHVQIRNRGTVGGSLAHADPAAEVPAIAVLLDATIVAVGPGGARTVPADAFFGGFLTTDLAEDELLTEVRLPVAVPGERWGFREFAQRRGDFALAGAAVTLRTGSDGAIDGARVAVFGTADRPVRALGAETILTGERPADDTLDEAARRAADAVGADDPRPDAAYRRHLTETVVRRALADALGDPGDEPAGSNGHRAAA